MTTGTASGPSGGAAWDVVATVRADRAYLDRFVAAYRQLGAAHIHIFFDDPAMAFLLDGSDLTLTVCDAGYWGGARPEGLEDRQTHNAGQAARRSTSVWMLHCDIDEILAAERPVAGLLAELPETVGCLMVRPVEAVFVRRPQSVQDIFGTEWFKILGAPRRDLNRFWSRIYKDMLGLTMAGFLGHHSGKCFVRIAEVGGLERFPLHKPSKVERDRLNAITADTVVLRHYDALLPAAWAEKHLDRASGRVLVPKMGDRRAELARLVAERNAAEGMDGVFALYDRLFVISDRRLHKGEARHALRRIDPLTTGLVAPGS